MSEQALLDMAESYVLDGEDAALPRALELLDRFRPDLAALLDALDRLKGDPDRKARAIVAIRGKLGLSLIPGPPCRSRPLR